MTGTLALSRPLLQWLREDPAWPALPIGLRARLHWQAAWGSVNAGLSAALARGASEPTPLQDPVLIVGPWRSGTTVMHELLVAATGCATPLTWQCMNACAFQLGAPQRASATQARPMDGLEIRHDSPQEDEFALLTLGAPSAYRGFWMPHRIGELHATLSPDYWLDNTDWLPAWEAFLRGVLRSSGAAARQPLILKSPNHSFRVAAILRRFPRARVVWMARDAGDVLASNRKMWCAMFERHGLTPPNPAALDAFLTAALDAAATALGWCEAHLPAAQWALVRHEALASAPHDTTRAVCRHLLPESVVDEAALARAVQRTGAGRIERYATGRAQDPAARSSIERLDAAQARSADRFAPAQT
jgi:omega-hydroxy-beta-dihydromenaquinone-9 sulfotransferase